MSTDDRQWKQWTDTELERNGGCLDLVYSANVERLSDSETKHLMNVARSIERRFKQVLDAEDTDVVATIAEPEPAERQTVEVNATVDVTDGPLELHTEIHPAALYSIRDGFEKQFHYEYLKLLRNHQ